MDMLVVVWLRACNRKRRCYARSSRRGISSDLVAEMDLSNDKRSVDVAFL